jgi:hypothetical protein
VEAYDGPQIVGMDLHRRRSVLVRMTPDGRRLGTSRITNSPAELRGRPIVTGWRGGADSRITRSARSRPSSATGRSASR